MPKQFLLKSVLCNNFGRDGKSPTLIPPNPKAPHTPKMWGCKPGLRVLGVFVGPVKGADKGGLHPQRPRGRFGA